MTARQTCKPFGYWTEENTIKEARKIVAQYGEDALKAQWLIANGRCDLAAAIKKHGGYLWIREALGIAGSRIKPRGYWTEENTIKEARKIVAQYGEDALAANWLRANGHSGLAAAISEHGGFLWIREVLGIAERKGKPFGYWTEENTIEESRKIAVEHGEDALTHNWLSANGHSGLSRAISMHGGFLWIREQLGLQPRPTSRTSITTPLQRREVNVDHLRQVLRDLQLEGVGGFTPAQMVVVLQQAGFDRLPPEEGRDLYLAATRGLVVPQELLRWAQGEEPEPPVLVVEEPSAGGPAAEPGPGVEAAAGPQGHGAEPGTAASTAASCVAGEEEALPLFAIKDPADQLRFLEGDIFASADDEAIEALVAMGLHQLWAQAYEGPASAAAVVAACQAFNSTRPWTARLQRLFLEQHAAATALPLPAGFNYRVGGELVEPRLMQRHVAALAQQRRRMLVMSDMGTGKSLASQLAVAADGAQRVLVIAINSCVDQWVSDWQQRWEGNTVSLLNMDAVRAIADGHGPGVAKHGRTVWVVPSHLMSLLGGDDDDRLVQTIAQALQPEAVILDEVHVFKTREKTDESRRRLKTTKLLTLCSDQCPDLMVLGLSGTVITNSLEEGRALLELVSGEDRADLPGGNGVAKAMRMHQALMGNGIRQQAKDDHPYTVHRPVVDASYLMEELRQALQHPPRLRPLQVEKVLIEARIPAVVEAINGPTIVATQYVEGFVEPLREALQRAGYRVGVHTGEEKLPVLGHGNAIEAFKAGAVDVLLASVNTLCTGVDGLQRVCSNMVIASMPWTAADYLQLVHRIARSGQQRHCTITIPTTELHYNDAELGWARWSFCDYRAGVIASKQRLMDAVMDGLIPADNAELTEAKTGHRLGEWLKRLDSKGVVLRAGRPITVPLVFNSEAEELQARSRYGSFSSCNGRWNNTTSQQLHIRLQRNPQEWELYHTDLEQLRRNWVVDPLQEAINRCSNSNGMVIGDFGCGTAQLAEALRGRHTVYSFDHIAINDTVTACDVAAGVPLPDESLDLAVFSLSLMGQNWRDQLTEAWRCLKPTGQVLIWTAASNHNSAEFCQAVERAGFKVITSQVNYKWLEVWGVRTADVAVQHNTAEA